METILFFISTFIFIFSILYILRTGIKFVMSLLSNPPVPLDLNYKDMLLNFGFLSYLITFIITLLS